jgi:CheY-like chemotaxis protein
MTEELSGTILIVEDDEISTKYLSIVLESIGLTIHYVQNGKEAIEYIKKIPDIDLILMDIRMPVMDGMEATRRIKKIRPELPIIAQSAYSFSNEKEKILFSGCDDFISKPIEPDILYELLEKYLKISNKISA